MARWARTATFPVGWATSGLRLLPDFMVIGAQRAGTTSVYRYLAQHPDVAPVRLGKGVHYFDTDPDRSFSWYRGHFPLDPAKVPGHRPSVTGEGAPYYIFHPLALERMRKVLPDAKLIAILRDPVERAHSHWVHETARGFETLSFEDALLAEDDRLAGEEDRIVAEPGYYSFEHQHHSYVARGQYAPQIERMWTTYPRDQTHGPVRPAACSSIPTTPRRRSWTSSAWRRSVRSTTPTTPVSTTPWSPGSGAGSTSGSPRPTSGSSSSSGPTSTGPPGEHQVSAR